jgi:hypothetical protein
MQVSGGFQVPADWCWFVLVGALVGDGVASDDPILAGDSQSCRGVESGSDAVQVRRERAASWFSVVAADS